MHQLRLVIVAFYSGCLRFSRLSKWNIAFVIQANYQAVFLEHYHKVLQVSLLYSSVQFGAFTAWMLCPDMSGLDSKLEIKVTTLCRAR